MKKYRLSPSLSILLLILILVIPFSLTHIEISQNGIYDTIFSYSTFYLRLFFGWIPFSIGDILYTFLFLYLVFYFIKWIKSFKTQFLSFFLRVISLASILYFCFYLLWGLNYVRIPLYKSIGLEIKPVNNDVLIQLTTQLIEKTNTLQLKLAKADSLKVEIHYSNFMLLRKASLSYKNLATKWPLFIYKNPSVKLSTYSLALSYMGYSGYYNPFTGEAQVNSKIPKAYMAFTACHEIAHQLGFAAEQEANFLGYLACIYSDDDFV